MLCGDVVGWREESELDVNFHGLVTVGEPGGAGLVGHCDACGGREGGGGEAEKGG